MVKERDPDALLHHIQQEESRAKRGKLKIYLGSAPGVGKTYKMLHDAYLSRIKNLDVVIGIVESHGRSDIERMLSKFEHISTQHLNYRDKTYAEFDLDAALKRDPGLILVDEMAHTNISGLRHDKRWQDINELLDRGIDVYTTLNVQHIESLKDNVAQIIQAPVKETVPDFMIERAHTIELVDLPVEEHLKRLKEGKIYIPSQADLAANHFFREGNLIALRELALRVTAAFVESDVMNYRKAEGIQHIWPTRDKILVCVGPNNQSLKLIRTAKRLASRLQAEWLAVYIDVPHVAFSTQKRNHAIQNLRLAEQLGAVTHVLVSKDIVKELLRFARVSNITQIMLSKDRSHSWRYWFHKRLADDIIAQCREINVYIVSGPKSPESIAPEPSHYKKKWRYYGLSVLFVGLATAINVLWVPTLGIQVMVYLLAALFMAVFGYLGPSLLISVLNVLALDYFSVPPIYQFKAADANVLVTMLMMFVVSIVISYLTLLKHREAKIARNIQQQTRALYELSRQLLQTRGVADILALSVRYIAQSFQVDVAALLPKDHVLTIRCSQPPKIDLLEKDRSIAQWVYDMAQPAGLGTDTLSASTALYLPLVTSSKQVLGVLRIQPQNSTTLFTPDQMRLLESCVNQLTLALDIDRLQEKSIKRQLKIEVDTAKNALLKTISTQLNYPLKFILGVMGASISSKDVAVEINDELNKISLINNNILQVIEFETTHINLQKQAVDMITLIHDTLVSFKKTHHNRMIQMHCPASLPKILIDEERIHEVLMNLLDNAIKYSLSGTDIDIFVEMQISHIWVSIENKGSLLTKTDLTRVFNPFYRGKRPNHQDSLGLGLTLCQLTIEAHQGQIWAENIQEKGVVAFRFRLPYLNHTSMLS